MKITDVKKIVSRYFGMRPETLDIKTRQQDIIIPRQIAHYICLEYDIGTLSEIGSEIGFKDHATVLHSGKVIRNMIATRHPFRKTPMNIIIIHIQELIRIYQGKEPFKEFVEVFDHKRQRYVSQKALIANYVL